MVSHNRVIVIGTLIRDPELLHVPSGTPETDVTLLIDALCERGRSRATKDTIFVEVTLWGKQAEAVCDYLRKGSCVLVEGRLKYDTWEHDGRMQSNLKIVCERLQIMAGPRRAEPGQLQAPVPEAPDTTIPF